MAIYKHLTKTCTFAKNSIFEIYQNQPVNNKPLLNLMKLLLIMKWQTNGSLLFGTIETAHTVSIKTRGTENKWNIHEYNVAYVCPIFFCATLYYCVIIIELIQPQRCGHLEWHWQCSALQRKTSPVRLYNTIQLKQLVSEASHCDSISSSSQC